MICTVLLCLLQNISDEDVLALVNEEVHAPPTIITLVDLQVGWGDGLDQ